MDKTISKKRLFNLFLIGVTVPLGAVGCGTLSDPSVAPTARPAAPTSATAPMAPEKPVATPVTPAPPIAAPAPSYFSDDGVPVAVGPIVAVAGPSAADEPAVVMDNSIWLRIRAGFRMPKMDAALTRPHEQWFIENVGFREAMLERSKLYLYYIVEEIEKRGMPMEIALLPAIESAYKPYAYSRARASGLWQFIPSTGKLYGLKSNWWYDGRRDVIASTRAALDYLQKLRDDFDGDWQLALAAYNAGEGRVGRAVEWNRRNGLKTDFVSLRQLKQETRHYVPKLMAMVNLVSNPDAYGIQLPPIPNEPYFARVETDSQVDLGVIARLTGMEARELHYINPGYARWTTDPNGPHHVLVPAAKKDVLVAGLNNLPARERVKWRHHEVRKGDTLHGIARRYQVTVEAIKTANNLTQGLRVGQSLLLPISSSAVPNAAPVATSVRTVAKVTTPGRPIVHQVRAGETLWSIAKRYNVRVNQLAEWNAIEAGDVLRYGQRLKVFTNDGPSARRSELGISYT
jgi:membrane-bound lytic murein transglycosylase D